MPDEPSPREINRQARRRLALVAGRQGGAIATGQTRECGLSPGALAGLSARRLLVQEHRGVWRLGQLTPDGRLWAAVLAMGMPVTISIRAAAHEHQLLRRRPPSAVDVTCPTQRRPRRGIRPHEGVLLPADIVVRRGLPFTTIARTLLDLAAVLPTPELHAAVGEARQQRRLHLPTIEAMIARAHGHHGIGRLRASVARHDPGRGVPRKELERTAARFLRDRSFPEHERNAEVRLGDDIFVVDVLFTGRKVVLELDSRAHHDNDPSFNSDRRRIRRFEAHGWRLIPITSTDLIDRPDELDRDLWAILGGRP